MLRQARRVGLHLMIEDYHGLKEEQKKRLMAYVEALKKIESLENM